MFIARNKDGRLNLFEGCPLKNEKTGTWEYYTIFSDCSRPNWEHWFSSKIIDRKLFPYLKWEDEPIEVEIISKSELTEVEKLKKELEVANNWIEFYQQSLNR